MNSKEMEELHLNLRALQPKQQLAIQLRFWEKLTIAQAAIVLGLSWDQTDRLIESTLCELKLKLKHLKCPAHCLA